MTTPQEVLAKVPLFSMLSKKDLARLASQAHDRTFPAGAVLSEEGEAYYAIAAGQLDVFQDGRFVRRCGRGEGVGEIALLRAVPRTATVTAHTDATVYKLAREPFLTAVLGHAATQRQALDIADARLAADATRAGDSPAAGTVGPG